MRYCWDRSQGYSFYSIISCFWTETSYSIFGRIVYQSVGILDQVIWSKCQHELFYFAFATYKGSWNVIYHLNHLNCIHFISPTGIDTKLTGTGNRSVSRLDLVRSLHSFWQILERVADSLHFSLWNLVKFDVVQYSIFKCLSTIVFKGL